MSEVKTVFDQTLGAYRERFKALSLECLARNPAIRVKGRKVSLPFFNEILHISDDGIRTDQEKEAPFEVCVVVYNYLLRYRATDSVTKAWVAYRDTKNSGPLTVYFTDSVEKKIVAAFGKVGTPLASGCKTLGGRMVKETPGYDLAVIFDALPSCQLFLLFNHGNEDFPPSCSVLFQEGVERFLDPESLAILGAVFASKLTGRNPA